MGLGVKKPILVGGGKNTFIFPWVCWGSPGKEATNLDLFKVVTSEAATNPNLNLEEASGSIDFGLKKGPQTVGWSVYRG